MTGYNKTKRVKNDEKGAEVIFMKMHEKHSYCKEKENNRLYKIGMFAQMNHITVKTRNGFQKFRFL